MLFFDSSFNYLQGQLIHFLCRYLLDPIFEDLFIKLFLVDIAQILSLIACKVPKGSLFDPSCHTRQQFFVTFRIIVVFEHRHEQMSLGTSMLHDINY